MNKLSLKEIEAEEERRTLQKETTKSSNERYIKLTFFIATEGTKTEPNYFNALKEELEKTKRFNIDISIEGKGKSTTALVKKVIRQVENNHQEYDRIWAVFDKDDFEDFDAAIELAKEHNVNCAWSNECFELWLLLHFEDVSEQMGRNDLFKKLETSIRKALSKSNQNVCFDLSKGDSEIYYRVNTLGNEEDAITRVSKLKALFNTSGKPFCKQNPCTNVDALILELRHPENIDINL